MLNSCIVGWRDFYDNLREFEQSHYIKHLPRHSKTDRATARITSMTESSETSSIHSESIHTDSQKSNLIKPKEQESGCPVGAIVIVILVAVMGGALYLAVDQFEGADNSRRASNKVLACDGTDGTYHQSDKCYLNLDQYGSLTTTAIELTKQRGTVAQLTRQNEELSGRLQKQRDTVAKLNQQNRELRGRLQFEASGTPQKKPAILDAGERVAEFRNNHGYTAEIYDNCSKSSIKNFVQCVHRINIKSIRSLGRIREKAHTRCEESSRWFSEYVDCMKSNKK